MPKASILRDIRLRFAAAEAEPMRQSVATLYGITDESSSISPIIYRTRLRFEHKLPWTLLGCMAIQEYAASRIDVHCLVVDEQ
jgi:hypothetical protein